MKKNFKKIFPIILGLEKGVRRLDGSKSIPSGLDWVSESQTSLKKLKFADPTYIGGYHIEKIIETFPSLKVKFYRHWEKRGEIGALSEINFSRSDHLFIRADTVPSISVFQEIVSNSMQSIGYIKDSLFSGIFYISENKIDEFKKKIKFFSNKNENKSLDYFFNKQEFYEKINVSNKIAALKDKNAVRKIIFQGKAQTLENLSGFVKGVTFPEQMIFNINDWNKNKDLIIEKIRKKFSKKKIVVRSSAEDEDSFTHSSAGYFHSELNVLPLKKQLILSINKVIKSYSKNQRKIKLRDKILIQEQIENISSSGVMFSRDPVNKAPYFVINIESGSGRTDIVTSGEKGNIKTFFHSWIAPDNHLKNNDLERLIKLCRELVKLTYNDSLDIEFGFNKKGQIYLFQVRPILTNQKAEEIIDKDIEKFLESCFSYYNSRQKKTPNILGKKTIFANMSDWNPAEMIGAEPRPLTLSLYQHLIGDWTWAEGRARIGYKNIGPEQLIHSFGGRPFVDVRCSLNSLLPADLEDNIGEFWINSCIEKLSKENSLQDKIEFDLTITCMSFDWDKVKLKMKKNGLSDREIKVFGQSLANLTSKIVRQKKESIDSNLKLLDKLNDYREKVKKINVATPEDVARKIKFLLDRCMICGIVPFVILARYAFIGLSFLRTLRDLDIISKNEYDSILMQIPSVATKFTNDLKKLQKKKVSLKYILEKYGHLRPHSYDITSIPYEKCKELFYFDVEKKRKSSIKRKLKIDQIFLRNKKKIEYLMKDLDLNFSFNEFTSFIKESISARENCKFEFMKSINDSLNYIEELGKFFNLDKEDLSYLTISEILNLSSQSSADDFENLSKRIISYRRKKQSLTKALRIPDVIYSEKNFFGFQKFSEKPNFITRHSVIAPVSLVETAKKKINLSGKIVAIRAADPGFDWIFGHNIAGLVTEYGGVASHMAIRAAEFDLPAAIGCGSTIFENLINSSIVELDCKNERVKPK